MPAELFQAAAKDPKLMQDTLKALQDALGSQHITSEQEMRTIVERAKHDAALRDRLAAALARVAGQHHLEFRPQSARLTDAELASVAGGKDNPTQVPIGTPIALLFIAAALIFLPSIFASSSESLFQ